MPRAKKQELKQRADGRYACRYKDKWFMGASSDEALAAREEYKKKEIRGELAPAPSVPTIGEYVLVWLPLHKKGVSEKCYNDYAVQLDALASAVGSVRLDALTVDQAAAVWDHYSNYSASTIKRARMLYTSMFDAAIENEYCTKNPFKSKYAQPPRGTAGTHRDLTEREIDLIMKTPHRFQLAAVTMLYTGIRRGECLALTRKDINGANLHYKRITGTHNHNICFKTASILKAQEIIINKAVRFRGNTPEIVDPKTEAGKRRIPILDPLRPFLEKFIASSGSPSALLCPSAKGDLMTETAFSRCWDSYIKALSAAAGSPVNIRTHDFRHTYCTMLFESGVIDLHQAMLWMGHADEKMILKIYDHVNAQRSQSAAERLNNALNGRQKP